MGRKKVAKRKQVTRTNSDGVVETGWETVYEWVTEDSSSSGSDNSSYGD